MSNHYYQSSFIGGGIQIKEPGFSTELAGAVFRNDQLREGIFLDFEHYCAVMNKTRKPTMILSFTQMPHFSTNSSTRTNGSSLS